MKYFLVLLLILLIPSCAFKEKTSVDLGGPAGVPTPEARTAVLFTYGPKTSANEIILRIGAEPVALACGYVRLVGTIVSERSLAALEIGGRGGVYEEGEGIPGYQVSRIREKEVQLCAIK